MNVITYSVVFFLTLCLSQGNVFAYGSKHKEEVPAAAVSAETPTAPVEVGNKICPVTGEEIKDSDMGEAAKVEYNGKIYNLCCSMCVKDFKKDPETYIKKVEAELESMKNSTEQSNPMVQ